jgi:hypothetical protein
MGRRANHFAEDTAPSLGAAQSSASAVAALHVLLEEPLLARALREAQAPAQRSSEVAQPVPLEAVAGRAPRRAVAPDAEAQQRESAEARVPSSPEAAQHVPPETAPGGALRQAEAPDAGVQQPERAEGSVQSSPQVAQHALPEAGRALRQAVAPDAEV